MFSPANPISAPATIRTRRAVLGALLLLIPAVVAIPVSSPAQAPATLTILHGFSGSDGESPQAALVLGSDGNFYGTTRFAGANGSGTVFRLTPAGVFTTLHTFSATDNQTGANGDGANPYAALVLGSDGNFYGTTRDGGSNNRGTVFSITPAGVLTTLHTFSATVGDPNDMNSDGAFPEAALAQGSDGNFYGTTSKAGSNNSGTVFRISPAGVLTTLYTFSAYDGNYVNSDGANPYAALVLGGDGNFYGTTGDGGSSGTGTVFRISPAGKLTTLYSFSAVSGQGTNSDGEVPTASLVQGSDGNFYGTTTRGGSGGYGTVFSLTPAGVFTTLHNFSSAFANATGTNGDGAEPEAALLQGPDGNFYGTAALGGAGGKGTVFSITPAGVFTTLHSFDAAGNGTNNDGSSPEAPLVLGGDGNFYGTTVGGGSGGDGTVFELTVHPGFFTGEAALANGVYYLAFPDGNYFGYYSYLTDPRYIYHFDLGYEYVFDAADGKSGVYFYDFKSQGFFYTSPVFPFPYLYDFSLNTVLYYYPDPSDPGHYNTNGVRYFYDFAAGKIINK